MVFDICSSQQCQFLNIVLDILFTTIRSLPHFFFPLHFWLSVKLPHPIYACIIAWHNIINVTYNYP